ncbi:MAG: hypothetical protein ACFFBD_01835 [Candidatus Hodarchaeota archaeon]
MTSSVYKEENTFYIKKQGVKDLQGYLVNPDGSLKSVEGLPFENLEQDKVYVFIDIERRFIFAWKGENAPNRLRFMAARAAHDIRRDFGTFKIEILDQGAEPKGFKTAFLPPPATPSPILDHQEMPDIDVHPFFKAQAPKISAPPSPQIPNKPSSVFSPISTSSVRKSLPSTSPVSSYASSTSQSSLSSASSSSDTAVLKPVTPNPSYESQTVGESEIRNQWVSIDDTAPIVIKSASLNVVHSEGSLSDVSTFINDRLGDFQIKRSGATQFYRNWNITIDVAVYRNKDIVGCIRATYKGGVLVIDMILTNPDIKRAEEQLLLKEIESYCRKKRIHKIFVLLSERDPFLNTLEQTGYEFEGKHEKHIFDQTWISLAKYP